MTKRKYDDAPVDTKFSADGRLVELTIDRDRWGRERLRKEDGSMCCLGFASAACGVSPRQLMFHNAGYPSALGRDAIRMIERHFPILSISGYEAAQSFVTRAININDSCILTSHEREEALRGLFRNVKVKLKFRGRTPSLVRIENDAIAAARAT